MDTKLATLKPDDIELLLFDLGGVLIEWDGIEPLLDLSTRDLSREDVRRFWLESPWVRKFEKGCCRPKEFAEGVVTELRLRVDAGQFLEEFVTWDRGFLPGAVELLQELKPHYVLGCLSNNNALHWQVLRDRFKVGDSFAYCFASHEIGLMKPEVEIFQHVLEHLPFRAEEILFLDDNPECVEAARSVNLRAFQVAGAEQTRQLLSDLGVHPRKAG